MKHFHQDEANWSHFLYRLHQLFIPLFTSLSFLFPVFLEMLTIIYVPLVYRLFFHFLGFQQDIAAYVLMCFWIVQPVTRLTTRIQCWGLIFNNHKTKNMNCIYYCMCLMAMVTWSHWVSAINHNYGFDGILQYAGFVLCMSSHSHCNQ